MPVDSDSLPVGGEETRLTSGSALAAISSLFCELEIVSGEHPLGTIVASRIGDATLLRSIIHAGDFTTARSERLIRTSTTDAFLLGLVVRGHPLMHQDQREARLSPGEMILIDSRRRYDLQITDATELVCLKLPRRSVETRIVEHGRYLGLPIRTDDGLGHVAGRMFEAFVAVAPRLDDWEGRRFEGGFVEMVGSALRWQSGECVEAAAWQSYKVFKRVEECLERNLANPTLTPSLISRQVGLSERYVRKLFAARGTTMTAWIRSRRLKRCHEALRGGDGDYASIAEIAYAHGFNDISSFNRSFRHAFGLTPGEVKGGARAAGAMTGSRA